jgi:hypothetical protein
MATERAGLIASEHGFWMAIELADLTAGAFLNGN